MTGVLCTVYGAQVYFLYALKTEWKLQKLWSRLKFFLLTSLTRPFVPSFLLAVNSDELSSLSKRGCDDSAASRTCTFENLQSKITIILMLLIYHTKFHLWKN